MTSSGSARYHRAINCLIVIVLLPSWPAFAGPLVGQATIIDGDTIEIHRQRIRLSSIDAPESDQLCRDDDSLPYGCGAKAANELDRLIAGRPVSCVDIEERTYKRIVAICTVGGVDLADWMVRQGLALDWPRYSKDDYAAAQREAQQAGRGYGRDRSCNLGTTGIASMMVGGLVIAQMMRTKGDGNDAPIAPQSALANLRIVDSMEPSGSSRQLSTCVM